MITTRREIKRRVQQRILNDCDSTSDPVNDLFPKLDAWINERYERIWNAKPWTQKTDKRPLQIVASQKSYTFPRQVGDIIKVFDKTNGKPIKETSVHDHIRQHAGALDQASSVLTGDPVRFYPIGSFTCKAELSQAETITVVSTSASDVSPLIVRVVGEVSGTESPEDIVLTGATSASGSVTFDASQKLSISIGTNDGSVPQLNGVVTVTGTTSGDTFSVISSFELATVYKWIEVSPTPKATGTQPVWDVWYRRGFQPLINDNDVPLLDCTTALIQGVYSDALREDGQEVAADNADIKFGGLVEELWSNQNTGDLVEQFMPDNTENLVIDDYGRTSSHVY